MLIGLTGGIGSGKSTALQFFQELGAKVISSDQITRQLMAAEQPVTKRIIDYFGNSILNSEQNIDRSKLRHLVFNSSIDRKWLEDLLHPLVKIEIQKLHQKLDIKSYLIAEIPLLIESHLTQDVDRILVIDCDESKQVQRLLKREATSSKMVQSIINTQVSRKIRLEHADDIIDNNGSIESLYQNVKTLHHKYTKLASEVAHKNLAE